MKKILPEKVQTLSFEWQKKLVDTCQQRKKIWHGKLLMMTFSYSSYMVFINMLKGSPRVCGAGARLAGVS